VKDRYCNVVANGFVALFFGAAASAQIQYPAGTETFESLQVGDELESTIGWPYINDSDPALYSVRVVDTPSPPPGLNSTRWVRVLDQDGGNVQNRFYSPTVIAPEPENYTWTYYFRRNCLATLEADYTRAGWSEGAPRRRLERSVRASMAFCRQVAKREARTSSA
jgi:hypothetical protein